MATTYTLWSYIQDITPAAVIPAEYHSGTSTTDPTWPRTDLQELKHWTSFADALNARKVLLQESHADNLRPASVDVDDIIKIGKESDLHAHADCYAFRDVKRLAVLARVKAGSFENPAGKMDVVGDPDRVWRSPGSSKPKLCVEFKTPWALPVSDIIKAYEDEQGDIKKRTSKAISQLNGYMTFNNHRYGVLSTYTNTWFFERTGLQSGSMRVAGPFGYDSTSPYLVHAYLTLLSMVDERWFYASPTSSPSPPSREPSGCSSPLTMRKVRAPLPPPPNDRYAIEEITPAEIIFAKTVDRSNAVVAEGSFRTVHCVFKIVDATQRPNRAEQLDHEVNIYRVLEPLQGSDIPTFHGYCRVWNMLHVLRMNAAGQSITANVCTLVGPGNILSMIRSAVQRVHALGVVHGDIRLANFLYDIASGGVKVIDFGQSRANTSAAEREAEMVELDGLDFMELA
ncbi:hypothetical protein BDZ88DRAFT_431511 [Geranomyces variabilis]|nr:hypothetical protein BDZ88DRAFT_431511 [Geranomyces variabilis]KAJ3131628.1 hypothetical protein HDU90_008150 [Geranomyces variabilis]